MQNKDYYKLLGVPREATPQEIKKAYRQLARQHHPDVNPGDKVSEEKFREINEAYEVLSDEEARAKYHDLLDHPEPSSPGGGDPDSSFFEQFFGRRQSRAAPRQGRDLHAEVEITLQEALHGAQRRLSLERQEACKSCHGTGIAAQDLCPVCRGRGQVIVPQTLDVKIPPGVTHGSTIKVAGQGGPGSVRGDLLLEILLHPDPIFRVEGHDLHREVELSIFTALLGGQLPVEGLRGTLNLKLPAETQNGKVFRLKGQGLPRSGDKPAGDLYAKVSLRIPIGLTEDQREQFRQLASTMEVNHA